MITVISPAQGAMFAPLALKFVESIPSIASWLTNPTCRAPVFTIEANVTTSSTAPSHTAQIAGAVTGGVAAVLVVIGVVVLVVRRRRGLSRRKSGRLSFSSSFIEAGPPATVTPFNPTVLEITHQASDSLMEQHELLFEHPDGSTASDPHTLSSMPAPVLPRSQSVTPVPTSLSSKELARLRTEALTQPPSDPSPIQPSSSPTVVSERTGAISSSDTRRLQSEVESLRREMRQLRTERFEPPPSYTLGGA
jgi:hypothetical protein